MQIDKGKGKDKDKDKENKKEMTSTLPLETLSNMRDHIQEQINFLTDLREINIKIKEDIDLLNKELQADDFLLFNDYSNLCYYNITHTKIYTLNVYLDRITKIINSRCRHEWVDDLIDIDPDRSTTITYCSICSYTKK